MKYILKVLIRKISVAFRRGPVFAIRWLWNEIEHKNKYRLTHEKRKSAGKDFPDQTFYVIGINAGWCGLFAIVGVILEHIEYAVKHGYIPVVDLQNYPNQYLGDYELFKENAWEYFFLQPMQYNLQDIKKAKNIILSTRTSSPDFAVSSYVNYRDMHDAPDLVVNFKELFSKYIKLNSNAQNICLERWNSINQSARTLGIHCRGTDYTALKPSGHPIQPMPEEVIQKAEQVMKEHHCTQIYLATEDADIYDLFAKHFGNKLIPNNETRWRAADLVQGKSNSTRLVFGDKNSRINSGMGYLSSIYILSRCDCFIAGNTRGTISVLMLNEHFDYSYIFDKGYYN